MGTASTFSTMLNQMPVAKAPSKEKKPDSAWLKMLSLNKGKMK